MVHLNRNPVDFWNVQRLLGLWLNRWLLNWQAPDPVQRKKKNNHNTFDLTKKFLYDVPAANNKQDPSSIGLFWLFELVIADRSFRKKPQFCMLTFGEDCFRSRFSLVICCSIIMNLHWQENMPIPVLCLKKLFGEVNVKIAKYYISWTHS